MRNLPRSPGTYALLLELRPAREICVGRLGRRQFPAGYYVYVGSGLGPGGLSGRLNRHLGGKAKLFWHIDYLLEHARVADLIYDDSGRRLECMWAATVLNMPGVEMPAKRFGASDCGCPAHLGFLGRMRSPRWELLQRELCQSGGECVAGSQQVTLHTGPISG